VALNVVYHLYRPGKGLLLCLAGTKKDILSLLVNKGKGIDLNVTYAPKVEVLCKD